MINKKTNESLLHHNTAGHKFIENHIKTYYTI